MSDFAKIWAAVTALNASFDEEELNALTTKGVLALVTDIDSIAETEDTTMMEAAHILKGRIRPAALDTYARALTATRRRRK